MVTVNGTTGVSKVQPNTIGSAEIVDASIAGTDLLTSNGIGYKTGDGGSVTQLTSKSTAVILNNPCGRIIMNTASLAAGATVTFILNNTLVTINDVVIANGVNNGAYRIDILSVWAGQVSIAVTNVTGGALSDAITFNYAVIKVVGA